MATIYNEKNFRQELFYSIWKRDGIEKWLEGYRVVAIKRWKQQIATNMNPTVEEARQLRKGLEHIETANHQTLLEDYIVNRLKRIEDDARVEGSIDYEKLFDMLIPKVLI